ncbi:MAG: hypothetical protein PGN08_03095 [Sphingomonas taxi]
MSATAYPSPDAVIADAVFALAEQVVGGTLDLWDDRAVATFGYEPVSDSPAARMIGRRTADISIVIERERGKPGCQVRFATHDTPASYEGLYREAQRRGFHPAGGQRKPPENGFLLDTLVASGQPIAILVMMRQDAPDAPAGVNIYPLPPGGDHAEV